MPDAASLPETRPGVIYIFERTDTGEMVVGRRLPPKGHDPRTWPRSGLGRLPDGYGSSTARPWMLAVRNKHGENIFRWTILAIYPAEMLKEIETRFIQHFKATLGSKCKNRAEDGTGFTGRAEWEVESRRRGLAVQRGGGFQGLKKARAMVRANGFQSLKKGSETQRTTGWVTLKAAQKAAAPFGGRIGGPVGGPIAGARKALAAAIRRSERGQRPWPLDNRRLAAAGLRANPLPVAERRQPKPGSKPARVLAAMLGPLPLSISEIASATELWSPGMHWEVRHAMGALRRLGWPIICVRNRFYIDGRHHALGATSGPVLVTAA